MPSSVTAAGCFSDAENVAENKKACVRINIASAVIQIQVF